MSNFRHLEINDDVRTEVANPNLDPKEMEYCALSSQTELRELVAANPKLPDQFARWMSKARRQGGGRFEPKPEWVLVV